MRRVPHDRVGLGIGAAVPFRLRMLSHFRCRKLAFTRLPSVAVALHAHRVQTRAAPGPLVGPRSSPLRTTPRFLPARRLAEPLSPVAARADPKLGRTSYAVCQSPRLLGVHGGAETRALFWTRPPKSATPAFGGALFSARLPARLGGQPGPSHFLGPAIVASREPQPQLLGYRPGAGFWWSAADHARFTRIQAATDT